MLNKAEPQMLGDIKRKKCFETKLMSRKEDQQQQPGHIYSVLCQTQPQGTMKEQDLNLQRYQVPPHVKQN